MMSRVLEILLKYLFNIVFKSFKLEVYNQIVSCQHIFVYMCLFCINYVLLKEPSKKRRKKLGKKINERITNYISVTIKSHIYIYAYIYAYIRSLQWFSAKLGQITTCLSLHN